MAAWQHPLADPKSSRKSEISVTPIQTSKTKQGVSLHRRGLHRQHMGISKYAYVNTYILGLPVAVASEDLQGSATQTRRGSIPTYTQQVCRIGQQKKIIQCMAGPKTMHCKELKSPSMIALRCSNATRQLPLRKRLPLIGLLWPRTTSSWRSRSSFAILFWDGQCLSSWKPKANKSLRVLTCQCQNAALDSQFRNLPQINSFYEMTVLRRASNVRSWVPNLHKRSQLPSFHSGDRKENVVQ